MGNSTTVAPGRSERVVRRSFVTNIIDSERSLGYLLVAPVVFLLLALVAYPFFVAIGYAVTDRTLADEGVFIGLENFELLWESQIYRQTVANTFIFTAGSVTIRLILGVGLALLLNESFRFRRAVRAAILLPWIVPTVLGTMAWLWLFNPNFSVLNYMLVQSGLMTHGFNWLTRLGAMVRIALPLARPGVLSAGIFSFTLSWNEFIYALTLVTASAELTIPVGVLVQLTRADVFFWGPLMAGALLGSVPVALVYSFFVDQYASGLTAGAVKG